MSQIPEISPLSIASWAGDSDLDPGVEASEAERAAVERLIFAYSYNWDARDAEATASLFAEDASVAFFLDGAAEASHRTVAKSKLLEEMTARTEMFEAMEGGTRHFMMNTVFGRMTSHPQWERHPTGDELLQVIDGCLHLRILDGDRATEHEIGPSEIVVVSKGLWHSPQPIGEVTPLYVTPLGGSEKSDDDDPR